MSRLQEWCNLFHQTNVSKYLSVKVVVLGVIGIALLVSGSFIHTESAKPVPSGTSQNAQPVLASASSNYEETLENKLSQLLSGVKGAGQVNVHITLESGNSQEYIKNTVRENKVVQEKDNSGGVRTTTETKETETLALTRDGQSGTDHPVVAKEFRPVIKGVVVVADGAGDAQVRYQLWRATQSVLGVPAHKVTILAHRK